MISATRSYYTGTTRCQIHEGHSGNNTDPNKCYTLSTSSETTNSVSLTCNGVCCVYFTGVKNVVAHKNIVIYTYVVQAESVYNGTKATITIQFMSLCDSSDITEI